MVRSLCCLIKRGYEVHIAELEQIFKIPVTYLCGLQHLVTISDSHMEWLRVNIIINNGMFKG